MHVDLFFFYAMVGYIMARRFVDLHLNATVPAAASRALVHPGTLVFLGLAR
jgi:hypothetical protein